jgi:glycosyltransferase involved in cell wall biosynthesis
MTVSVVIPAYNAEAFINETVESALAQTHPPSEVIVVDDGSTDATLERLQAYERRLRVIRQSNQGVAAARNAGAAAATSEFIALLDADDVWYANKLERQLTCFGEDPELGLVHCGLNEIDERGRVLGTLLDGKEGGLSEDLLMLRGPAILCAGSSAIVPRSVFEELGGFDPALSTSADWDFCYRLARRYRVGFVRDILFGYRLHGTNMHRNIGVMARDMLHAYAKAFSEPDPRIARLKRRAYGRLHFVLAGAFFQARAYDRFLLHSLKSLVLTPGNVAGFITYPSRIFARRRGRQHARVASSRG